MTVDEMNTAFSEGLKLLKQDMSVGGTSENQQAVILGALELLRDFIVDHKRSADALEKIASELNQL